MNNLSTNIALKAAVKGILFDLEMKIPQLFSSREKLIFDTFLVQTGLKTTKAFIVDVELFLHEELDFDAFNINNVSRYDFKPLAIKFGDRYNLESLSAKNNNELAIFGWKSIRVMLLDIILFELKKLEHYKAQTLILVIENFIRSFSLMQGESAETVLEKLKFWEIFKDYQFSLEADKEEKLIANKALAPEEYVLWQSTEFDCVQFGKELEQKYGLIKDNKQWELFFDNHTQKIEVVSGKIKRLTAVLCQLQNKGIVGKNKGKAYWKIWEEVLIDSNGNKFTEQLRKFNNSIKSGRHQTDKDNYEFGLNFIKTMTNKK